MIEDDIAHVESDRDFRKLVASRHIYQGETIVVLPLHTLDRADKYSIEAMPGIHIDCTDSPAGSCNHSCVPNAAVRYFRIVAWECIKQGEEITINYKRTEDKLAVPFLCRCGNCEDGTWIR